MVKADCRWSETRCWGEGTGSLPRLLSCERGSLMDGAARCWIEPSVSLHWWDAADLRLPVPVCSSAHIVGDTQDSPVSKAMGHQAREARGKTALSQDLGVVYLKPFNPPAPPPPPPTVTLQQLQRRRASVARICMLTPLSALSLTWKPPSRKDPDGGRHSLRPASLSLKPRWRWFKLHSHPRSKQHPYLILPRTLPAL